MPLAEVGITRGSSVWGGQLELSLGGYDEFPLVVDLSWGGLCRGKFGSGTQQSEESQRYGFGSHHLWIWSPKERTGQEDDSAALGQLKGLRRSQWMRQRPEASEESRGERCLGSQRRGGQAGGCSWGHGLRKLGERWGPKVYPKSRSVGRVLRHGWMLRGGLGQCKAQTHLSPVREWVHGEE